MPLLLDLFCGAGGAGMGYANAGFRVIGVDHKPQPNYPFEFHRIDALHALELDLSRVDAIHASPPCQAHSPLNALWGRDHPDHIPAVRNRLSQLTIPWIIENVPGAPLRPDLILCGSMFGLFVRRHRVFESNRPLPTQGTGAGQSWLPSVTPWALSRLTGNRRIWPWPRLRPWRSGAPAERHGY
jgi:DNA (cytosine-5)-methyltransferase 1